MDDSARINVLEGRIAELERKLNYFMQQLNLSYTPEPLSPALTEAAIWLRKGEKIEAIKSYQTMTGKGLKESKEAVEALEKKLSAS